MVYLQHLEAADILNKVETTLETVTTLSSLSETHTVQIESQQSTSDRLVLTIQDIHDTLENIPNLINIESLKIDGNMREIRAMKETIRQLRNSSAEHEGQINELLKLQEQMIIIKDLYELQEERIKKILKTLAEVFENQEMAERRVDEFNGVIQVTEEKLYHRLSLNQRLAEDKMIDYFADYEQKFGRLQERLLAAVSEIKGGGTGGGGGGGAGKKFPKAKLKFLTQLSMRGGGGGGQEGGGGEGMDGADGEEDSNLAERDEQMDLALQLCLSFEDVTGYRNISPKEIPSRMCGEIASMAQQLAILISSSVDHEAIKRSITRQGDGSTEEAINELRTKLMNQTIQGMKRKLNESSPTPGPLQQEARTMFLNRMQQALQVAMSKHDQVVSMNSTRLGRIKLPTCIACDRPMGTKVCPSSVVLISLTSLLRSLVSRLCLFGRQSRIRTPFG
jgi:hypothetical protein